MQENYQATVINKFTYFSKTPQELSNNLKLWEAWKEPSQQVSSSQDSSCLGTAASPLAETSYTTHLKTWETGINKKCSRRPGENSPKTNAVRVSARLTSVCDMQEVHRRLFFWHQTVDDEGSTDLMLRWTWAQIKAKKTVWREES